MNNDILEFIINNQRIVEYKRKDGTRSIAILIDGGYEPIAEYRDNLIQKYNFELTSAYGLTNIVYEFTKENNKYVLLYDCDEDMITFKTKTDDERLLNEFRNIAANLKSINEKKNEDEHVMRM